MNQSIFLMICLSVIIMAFFAGKRDNKFLLWSCIMVLSLVAGFRTGSVGRDTQSYIYAFNSSFMAVPWQFKELGFRLISTKLMAYLNDARLLLLVYAFITNALISLRLWDYRKKANFSFLMFIYIFVYYIETMNIMRQFIAIAIIFWGTRLLESKKYIPYIALLIVAISIHTTAFFGTIFLAVYIWQNATNRKKL